MAIYGYTRVSTDRQADEGISLDVQQRQITGWCMIDGSDLTEMIVESGVSGGTPLRKRPLGRELLGKVRRGDTIVATRLDRVFRNALDALETSKVLKDKGVRLVLLDLGGDVTGNGMAKAFFTMAAAFAELERDTICERVSSVKKDQRSRGRYLGGKVPFGYNVIDGQLVPRDDEIEIMKVAQGLRNEGLTLRDIQGRIEMVHRRRLSLATLSRIAP